MSPFRRRKRPREQDLRVRARRARLAERERLAYERERAAERGEEPYEPERPEDYEPLRAEEADQPQRAAEVEERRGAEKEGPSRRPAPRRPERRRPRRRRIRPGLRGLRSASATGARATVRQARPGVGQLGSAIGRLLGWVFAWPLRLAALVERVLVALLGRLAAAGVSALESAERRATPERVLVLVTGGAAACLVYSQFVAYRGVEVGQPQYSQVSTVAPPPQTDRIHAGAAHAYVLIPLAAIAVAAALWALLSGRWRLSRVVSLVGLAGIVISLAIDLPKGLDAGTAGLAFAGAKATMTEGFYAQIAASAVLVLCGWALAINLRLQTGVAGGRRGPRRSPPRPRRAASVAGGGA